MTKEQLETIRDFLNEKREGYIVRREFHMSQIGWQNDPTEAHMALSRYNNIAATECGVMLADVMVQLSELE